MSRPDPAAGSLRVLVVDDEADVRLGLRLLSESLGAEVREAESGEEALGTLGGWTPHVMLTDITMDGMSGMELLRHVHEHHPEVKVLMITGYGSSSPSRRCGAARRTSSPSLSTTRRSWPSSSATAARRESPNGCGG